MNLESGLQRNESGNDNRNIEEIVKGEKKKNAKESRYTNMDEDKKGKQANILEDEKPENCHETPTKREKLRKLWSQRKWPCQTWAKTFL